MPLRSPLRSPRLLILLAAIAAPGASANLRAEAQEPGASAPPEALDFFETSVRPVLAEHCLGCHGPEKQSSGLRLDSREAALRGGNTGPAFTPGDPEDSTLILAVRHEDEILKMPPEDKLPDEAVEALTAWIKMGAPWPAGPSAPADASTDASASHWAFRPVQPVEPPDVTDRSWVASPVDAFILARLEREGLTPSPQADRRTLIRRASFDLTGLPPTPEEVEDFVNDPDPNAYEALIDGLLASPRYGERWGRHWLDVARYADTKGYVFQEERKYAYSYTYRDYVIDAFNDDLPYDQFILQQIAADLLPPDQDRGALAAMGFLTVGRRFLNNGDDIIDDRIDVVTRGLLGLTVSCARCHDHKYDPIPTEDYYSLYGVFASSFEPEELPMIGEGKSGEREKNYQRQREARQREVDAYVAARREAYQAELRSKLAPYLLAAYDLEFNPRHPKADERTRADGLRPELLRHVVERWKAILQGSRAGQDPAFAPWHAFAALPADAFAEKAAGVAGRLAESDESPPSPVVAMVAGAVAEPPPSSMREVVERYAALLARAVEPRPESPGAAADPALEAIRARLEAAGGPIAVADDEVAGLFNREERNKHRSLAKKVAALEATHDGAPARAMVLNDKPQPVEPRVFLRGNSGRPGKAVPRRFLKVLSGPDREPFAQGSGRLELARQIARGDNPLTARVMVNRIWMHHFGEGLVRTPSDFGLRSEPPSHPELLDYLATQFVEGGWSIKRMHRLIMLSNAYRQRSEIRPDCAEADPQNLLLWRQDRHRLEFEPLRDAILAVAGRLDPIMGGRPVPISSAPFTTRRTVYGFIDRQNLDGVFRAFDLANPDASSPRRFETIVPQQALFLMNSPFIVEQARHLAARPELASIEDVEGRVQAFHRLLFGRPAEAREVDLAARFLRSREEGGEKDEAPRPAWQYGYGSVDEASGRVDGFLPLTHWTGKAWQFGDQFPHPEGSYLMLTAEGGHVGKDQAHSVIRRWVAPIDAVIAVDGALVHGATQGDGVRGRIVADLGGVLGTWTAHHGETPTTVDRYEVERGETIDFVVDCRGGQDHDSFGWAPVVRVLEASSAADGRARWDARAEFGDTPPAADPLSPWEAYAQVLLLTNEFLYID